MPTIELIKGAQYYHISDADYQKLLRALDGSGFSLSDFNFLVRVENPLLPPELNGYFAAFDEITEEEFDFMLNFSSFGLVRISQSVQGYYVGP